VAELAERPVAGGLAQDEPDSGGTAMANKAKTRKTRATKKVENLTVAPERADEVVGGVRKAGEKPLEYMTYTMENVVISSVRPGSSD
jgi:hypothetical protein